MMVCVNLNWMGAHTMSRSVIVTCLLAATLVAFPGLANGQNRERQQLMADLRMLHEQTMRLQLQISALDESLQRLTQLATQLKPPYGRSPISDCWWMGSRAM